MKKYLFIAGLLLPFLIVARMNWFEDAKQVLSEGNFGKDKQRVTQAYVSKNTTANAAFFGTSRSGNFNKELFRKIEMSGIKMGFDGASLMEERYYFEHLQNIKPLKTAVIELNFRLFTEMTRMGFSKDRLLTDEAVKNPIQRLEYYFSFPKDVYSSLFSPPAPITGLYAKMKDVFDILQKFKQGKGENAVNINNIKASDIEKGMIHFRKIIEIAKKNKTDTYFFIPPLAPDVELAYYEKKWGNLENWKRDILSVIEEEKKNGGPVLEIWDFSGFNKVTLEPFEDGKRSNIYFKNLAHFNIAVADMIFDRIFNVCADPCVIPSDFGVLLTPATIDTHLARQRMGKSRYMKTKPPASESSAARLLEDVEASEI